MKNCFSNTGRRGGRAFTLIEILVTMTLLTVIVLGLLAMFNQTQRAFRAGMGQTDVLEGGRGAIDMLVRELEQLTPSEGAITIAGRTGVQTPSINFWTGSDPNFPKPMLQFLSPPVAPLNQTLYRTNSIQQFFLLTRYNQDFNAVLYRVQPDVSGSAVGSLYRYATTWPRNAPLTVGYTVLYGNTSSSAPSLPTPPLWSNNRIADGIMHLQLRVFDTNGVPLLAYNNQALAAAVNPIRPSVLNATTAPWVPCDVAFWSNSVPAYIELEMGILEPKTLQHYRAIDPTTPAALNYLSNHVGSVYLFRQRIPIRNVDFTAYQ